MALERSNIGGLFGVSELLNAKTEVRIQPVTKETNKKYIER